LVELRSPRDHEKSDHESMTNFENLFQRYKHRKQLLDYDEYDVETESYDDSNSFVD
jgi:hypothetical protein